MIPLYLDKDAPTGIHGLGTYNKRELIKNPITYMSSPSIVLNDPTDSQDDSYDVESVAISPLWDAVTEPNPDRDGSQSYEPREVQKMIRISGFVRAPSLKALNDKIAALNRAFNPVLTFNSDAETSETDIGFVPLKFKTPTADTTNWPLGYIPQQYYARSLKMPVSLGTKFDDMNARFEIVLFCADPRKYDQNTDSASRAGAGAGTGTLAIDISSATYPSFPVVELAFVSAPSLDISYKYTSADTPVVEPGTVLLEADDLTDAAGETLIIDHQQRKAYYQSSGEDKTLALKSNSRFFQLVPGSYDLEVTGLAVNATFQVIYRRAFV